MEINKKVLASLVIPVYGSQDLLPTLLTKIKEAFNHSQISIYSYEIIFVCDSSPDNSWQIIKDLSIINSQVRGILLRTNAGQHNAIMAGLEKAKGEIIITMDDDLQHSPDDIFKLIDKINLGADVVYARFNNRSHALWKILGSKLNNYVASYLLKKPRDLYLSPFRAFKSGIKDQILQCSGPYVYIDGLILSITKNISSVDVSHYKRLEGEGNYSFGKSVSLWLKMATSFSIVPLRLTSLIGLIISGLGFISALLLIIQKFALNQFPVGWSSIIVAVLIIGGFQLLALGIIGEYVGRILLTVNNAKPKYVISEKVGFSQNVKQPEDIC
jgi:undecaprenyl-phosphate 4-deoxy-4-formamido-L-arabinose transferase